MLPVSPDDRALEETVAAERVAALGTVALQLAGARTPEALTRIVVEQGLRLLGARGGALGLRDDARGILRYTVAGYGGALDGELDEAPLDAERPASFAARTGEAVFLGDQESALAAFPGLAAIEAVRDVQAWACLPLRAGGRVLGVLAVHWAQPRRFAPAELELLAAFAAQCGQALERMEADAARARSERRLALLAAATAAVAASLDVPTALDRLASTLVPALGDW